MNEEHPHVHEEVSAAERAWDFLFNIVLFAVITFGLGWVCHNIWDSLDTGLALSYLNWVGILWIARFVGFAFNYDVGGEY